MDGSGALCLLCFIGAAAIAIAQSAKVDKKKRRMDSRVRSLPGFSATQRVMGCDGESGIAFDEVRKKICLITNKKDRVRQRVVAFGQLLSSELFDDGVSVTRTVRGSQIGGAMLGGLVFGGVGAVVGGLSGTTETSEGKAKRLELRLTVNDTIAPLHDVVFLNVESSRDGATYKSASQQARHWHAIIAVLIKRADAEQRVEHHATKTSAPEPASASIADEIRKLVELRDSGALTDSEFQEQKIRLLRRSE